MAGRVHAILVVRPDGRTSAAFHLRRTLAALIAQTRRPDVVTIVVCGTDPAVEDALRDPQLPRPAVGGTETALVRLPARARFAAATRHVAEASDADLLWLLAQDTAPDRRALEVLAGQIELSDSLGYVAPKLVRADDPRRLVSLGVSMTGVGRSVELAAGEFDQGQNDGATDPLGADIRGILVRASLFRSLRGIDPALRGADEGLDLAVATRLMGGRVALVPAARVAVDGDGVAGLPFPARGSRERRLARVTRAAQLHRRLVYTPAIAVLFVWLSLPIVALGRSLGYLLTKEPGLIFPEWAATVVAMVRWRAIARARRRIRRHRAVPWSRLDGLRVSRAVARERTAELPDGADPGAVRSELRFFSGGGAWLVLAMAAVSVIAFPALLAWPVLGGGALEPLRQTVGQLWADAAYGLLPTGWNVTGPADPFSAVVAVLGSLWPFAPSRVLVVLWLAALPLAALGGWFAATRLTERPVLRIVAGLSWAMAPTLLVALTDGVPTGVVAHLILPWVVFAGAVAHRSWVAAGATSLLLAGLLAAAPSLAPAVAVLVVVGLLTAALRRAGGAVARMLWLLVPAVALSAPLVWTQVRAGNAWALLADPGAPIPGAALSTVGADRWWIALGFPSPAAAGWADVLPGVPIWWIPLLIAPLALLAAVAAATPRWPIALVHLSLIVLGVGTALGAAQVAVRIDADTALPGWPGPGLSLAWWGLVGAAVITLDQLARVELRRYRSRRPGVLTATAAGVVMASLLVLALPALSAFHRGATVLAGEPATTLPAYVSAEAGSGAALGTLVIAAEDSGGLAVRVVWGASDTIGSRAGAWENMTTPDGAAQEMAAVTAALATDISPDAVADLAAQGIAFVLLAPVAGEGPSVADTVRREVATALDQRDDLDPVGATEKGELWRVTVPVAARPTSATATTDALVVFGQIAVFVIAVLLAIPTRKTLARARRQPRVVGLAAAERDDAEPHTPVVAIDDAEETP